MIWHPAETKPKYYELPVLLALINDDYTVGHWGALGSSDCWIGYAFNQSPPFYVLDDGVVTHWAAIEPPEER